MNEAPIPVEVAALNALKRAGRKVAEEALKNNRLIPIWKDGRVQYVTGDYVLANIDAGENRG